MNPLSWFGLGRVWVSARELADLRGKAAAMSDAQPMIEYDMNGLITGANDRYESKTAAGTPYIVERDIGDQIPGLDFGVSFDVEYRLQFLSIAARYTHGLTDISQSGSGTAVYSRTLTGTGRIYLGKKGQPKPK